MFLNYRNLIFIIHFKQCVVQRNPGAPPEIHPYSVWFNGIQVHPRKSIHIAYGSTESRCTPGNPEKIPPDPGSKAPETPKHRPIFSLYCG